MKKIQILIVDDFKEYLEKLTGYFSKLCVVYTENSFIGAIKMIKEKKFSLIISDVYLLDGLGLNLINLVKKNSPKTVCIAVSGKDEIKIKHLHSDLIKYDYFIQKPLSYEKLNFVENIIKDISVSSNKEVFNEKL